MSCVDRSVLVQLHWGIDMSHTLLLFVLLAATTCRTDAIKESDTW